MKNLMLGICGLAVVSASAALADGIDDDVYVVLYQRRVLAAEAMKERYMAQREFDQAHYDMYSRLRAMAAASVDETREAYAKLLISTARIKEGEVAILEAKSLLQVAKARRTTGLEMPVCPTILQ